MKSKQLLMYGAACVVLAVFIIASVMVMSKPQPSDANAAQACKGVKGTHHIVAITDGTASPKQTNGKLCDSLTITNHDKVAREIAFGAHEGHVAYDGVSEKVLNKAQSLTIVFDKVGNFHFHDHLHDEVEGFFTVTK